MKEAQVAYPAGGNDLSSGVAEIMPGAPHAELQRALQLLAGNDLAGAAEHARQAATLYRQAGDSSGLARALLQEAEIAIAGEQHERVLALTGDVRRVLGSGPSAELAQTYNLQAMVHFLHGEYREASAASVHEASLREALGDHEGLAKCLNNLGSIHIELGDLPTALLHLTRCFEYITACPAPLESLASACQINIGNAHHLMRAHVQATDAFRQGVEVAQRAGHVANEIAGLTGMGLVAVDGGAYRDALQSLLQALSLAQAHGRRYDEAEILDALGQAYAGLGQHDLACATLAQALEIAEALGATACQQNAHLHLARVHVGAQRLGEAVVALRAALTCAEHSGSEGFALEVHEELGAVLQTLGHFEDAAVHLRTALHLERTLKDRRSQDTIQTLTANLAVERSRHQADTYRLLNETSERARAEAETLVRTRTADLEDAQRDILMRLGVAGEYRDDKTGAHTQRVSSYAASLAAAIGLPPDEVEVIRLAARLHDIGKIGVPDSILLKAGRLTEDEFTVMKHHTTIGARVLSGGQSALMRRAEEIALTHHERWDGGGYPQGLVGEAIPLSGRIVAIVDVWDALTTERAYKPAWTREEAWRELSDQAGRQFDPHLVEVFLGMLAGTFHAEPDLRVAVTPAPDDQPVMDEARWLPAHVLQHIAGLNETAWQARRTDPALSVRSAQEAHLIADQHGDTQGLGYALRTLAFHDLTALAFKAARDRFHQAVEIARASGDLLLERDCLNLLGNVYRGMYSTERAMTCLLQSIELSRQLGDLGGTANALMNLGVMASSRLKDMERALGYYQQAYDVLLEARNEAGQAACLYSMADAFQEQGRFRDAHTCGQRAVDASRHTGDTLHHALSLSVMARALDAQGDHGAAAPLHREALALMRHLSTPMPEPMAWIELYFGANLLASGALPDAVACYEQVLAESLHFDLKELASVAHRDLTQVYKRLGNMEAAMHHLEAERALQHTLFEHEAAQRTRGLMAQYEVERAESEAALYKLRSVELASANVALEQANREKSALVSALQEQSALLEKQVREDSLSGVSNRRHIEQVLNRQFEEHHAAGRVLSVIMLDVDHFKRVNDTFSHLAGDEVLRRLGAILRTGCRPGDAAGRYGGEEFVLVLPDTPLEDAAMVAEQLRRQVEGQSWEDVAAGLRVTVSLGVASSGGLANFERLVASADAKLYEAKGQRNRVAC